MQQATQEMLSSPGRAPLRQQCGAGHSPRQAGAEDSAIAFIFFLWRLNLQQVGLLQNLPAPAWVVTGFPLAT